MKWLKKYGLNVLTLFAIGSLAWLGFTEQGTAWANNLLTTRPVIFYWGLGSFYLATFGAWVAIQIKRWK